MQIPAKPRVLSREAILEVFRVSKRWPFLSSTSSNIAGSLYKCCCMPWRGEHCHNYSNDKEQVKGKTVQQKATKSNPKCCSGKESRTIVRHFADSFCSYLYEPDILVHMHTWREGLVNAIIECFVLI